MLLYGLLDLFFAVAILCLCASAVDAGHEKDTAPLETVPVVVHDDSHWKDPPKNDLERLTRNWMLPKYIDVWISTRKATTEDIVTDIGCKHGQVFEIGLRRYNDHMDTFGFVVQDTMVEFTFVPLRRTGL